VTIRISDREVEQVLDLADLRLRATSARGRVSVRTIPASTQRYRHPGYLRPGLGEPEED
jgi:hypothetical protein